MSTLTAQLVPYGTIEVLTESRRNEMRAHVRSEGLKGKERGVYTRAFRDRVANDYTHLFEVYGLVFGDNTEKVIAFNRQYDPVGRLTWNQAFDLLDAAKVTSTWGGYSIKQFKGDTVWIAHVQSADAKRAEPHTETDRELLIALRAKAV